MGVTPDSDPMQSGSSEWFRRPERLRERLTEERSWNSNGQVGSGGWFPRGTITAKWPFFPFWAQRKTSRVAPRVC